VSKKDKTQEHFDTTLLDQVKRLENKLRQLEQTRSEQVEELLAKQAEMMSDIAELLTRCIQ
jgi:hypothetical protein